jgi:hypothetical protein
MLHAARAAANAHRFAEVTTKTEPRHLTQWSFPLFFANHYLTCFLLGTFPFFFFFFFRPQ